MKNKVFRFLAVICMALSILLCGCGQSEDTVHFEGNNAEGGEYTSRTVRSGKKLTEPAPPVRDGNIFLGWFADAGLTEQWDFGKERIKFGLTLCAGWDEDTRDEIAYPENDKDFSKLPPPPPEARNPLMTTEHFSSRLWMV